MSEMTPEEFAVWKQKQEEKIIRLRVESEEIHRAAEELRLKSYERAEKDRLAEEEFRNKADERVPKPGTAAALRMEKTERNLNGWFDPAEELENEFSDALEEKMQVGEIVLDEVRQRMNHRHKFDLVGINSDAIVVGKVKCELLPEDVRHFAENHLPYFAEEFSTTVEGRKIYGMVCGGTIVDDAVTEAVKLGLFVLRLKNKELLVENVDTACPVN